VGYYGALGSERRIDFDQPLGFWHTRYGARATQSTEIYGAGVALFETNVELDLKREALVPCSGRGVIGLVLKLPSPKKFDDDGFVGRQLMKAMKGTMPLLAQNIGAAGITNFGGALGCVRGAQALAGTS
jgi:hypothetical protein